MKRNKIDILTLGCSKNLVDSEKLMRQLELCGYDVAHDPEMPDGEIAVINTCGFIGDAKEESINVILEMAERKKQGDLRQLIVMGCLSQRYLADLPELLPEVDAFYGKFDWEKVITDLGKTYVQAAANERHLTTPSHYAYIKISEGCNRHCAYCAIPIITGPQQSRPMEEILDEVAALVKKGVVEFQIIAQELTSYGTDLYGKRMIAELIDRMAQLEGVEWIRLHYAYPTSFPMELLPVMARHDNICKYLDVALQHVSDGVLSRMRRHIDKEQTYAFIEALRREVPGIHIRTTLMVGFPGETEEEFAELVAFTKWARFDRMGAFAYSEEEGTYSADNYADDIPEEVKQARLSKLMRVQQNISAEVQNDKIGQQLRVIIDRTEGDYLIGRTEFDSPEVDPEVLILSSAAPHLRPGQFCLCQIDSADDFDLYAHPIDQ